MKTRLIAALIAVVLAVGGTLALIGYVRGADARALEGTRTVNVLVATQAIPKGTPAQDLVGLISAKALPEMAVLPDRVTSLDQLAGQVVLTDLVPGEQLVRARFADPATAQSRDQGGLPEGMQEVTIQLDPKRAVGGNLAPGDTVGVFLSFTPPVKGYTTHLKFQKVLVTRVQAAPLPPAKDSESADAAGGPAPLPTGDYLISLALDAPMAERVVFTAEHGTIWLSNEPLSANEAGASIVTPESVYE